MSRYDRFREILDQVVGDSSADYGGIGPFWKLDRNRLLEASMFDVRVIAPEKALTGSCCGHGTVETTETTRSARSGLVTGLRGEAAFDGSRLPQLPWGGRPVVESDVLFITWWIDDGYPRNDSGGEIGNSPVSTGPVTIEREGYSVSELKRWPTDSRSYNNLAPIHQNYCQRGWERFLPWHPVYMYEFEQTLEDHCPEVPQMSLTDGSLTFLPAHRLAIATDKVELTCRSEWICDYNGSLVPVWRAGDSVQQRPAIAGSVSRTIPHPLPGDGTTLAESVASLYAVGQD